MSYGWRIRSQLPLLPNYKMAAEHEAKVVGLRNGKNRGLKPLGQRRATFINIRREPDGCIIIQHHNTDFLCYHPDGRLDLDTGKYTSATNNELFTNVVGTDMVTFDSRTWVYCRHPAFDEGVGYMPIGSKASFQLPENRYGGAPTLLSEPRFPKVHTVNREKMGLVRRHYADFAKYGRGVVKLLITDPENPHDWKEISRAQRPFIEAAAMTFGSIGDDWRGFPQPKWPSQSKARLRQYGERLRCNELDDTERYQLVLYLANYGSDDYRRASLGTFESALTKLMLLSHPDVLDSQTVTTGKKVKDKYAFVFNN